MKKYLTIIVIYFSVFLGPSNLVYSVNETGVTTDSAVSDYSTPVLNIDTTSGIEPSLPPNSSSTINSSVDVTTTVQSITDTTSTLSSASGGISYSTTTASSCPWKVVALSLSGVCGVLLLAFTITIFILCKMRNRLGQASKTLYPITPSAQDHEYLDLESGTQNKYKNGVKVELKNITTHDEEEFDSPTFSPTPPVKPKRSAPPPIPSSNPPSVNVSDEAPQLPSRANSRDQLSKTSKKNIQGKSSSEHVRLQSNLSGSNSSIGETNRGFEQDVAKSGKRNEIKSMHDEDGDEMYESYEHGNPANSNTIDDDFDDIQAPYEEPVKSSAKTNAGHFIERQGSSTGLPELTVQRVSSREQVQDVPLQGSDDEEEFDDVGFGTVDHDSGLPGMTGMHNIDDLQYFDDPDAMTAPGNETNKDADELKNKEHEDRDVPSPTSDSIDDLLTYDDADMDFSNINGNGDDGDEPGFYEDFDMNDKNLLLTKNKATSNEKVEPEESELPKVPPRRKSTIDKNRDLTDNTKLNVITSRSDSTSETSDNAPNQSGLPSIPPRRDLLRKESDSESSGGSFDEIDPAIDSPPVNMDTFPGEVAQRRSGKKIAEQGKGRPRDSYFLDIMDETPVELSENNSSNNVLSSEIDDMTGFAGLSNGNAHLSEFGGNDTEFE